MTGALVALLLTATPSAELVPLDKVAHASVSANIVLGVAALSHQLGAPKPWAIGIGVTVALGAGLARELLGNHDWADMAANSVGICAGALTAFFLLSGDEPLPVLRLFTGYRF